MLKQRWMMGKGRKQVETNDGGINLPEWLTSGR